MKYQSGLHQYVIKIAVITTLACGLSAAAAADTAAHEPMGLRTIMQDLGRDMMTVTDSIAREDWTRVAQIAPRIAEHPEPPLQERMRIVAFMGSDLERFKSYDTQTHQAAHAMAMAAAHGDGPAVIEAFASVQKGCLACHQAFRKSFVNHFHEQH